MTLVAYGSGEAWGGVSVDYDLADASGAQAPEYFLVTGASRGVGAEVATQPAGLQRHVIVNYRDKAQRAGAVVDAVRAAGGDATAVQADVTDEQVVATMLDDIGTRLRPGCLVLNASGGLSRAATPAMR